MHSSSYETHNLCMSIFVKNKFVSRKNIHGLQVQVCCTIIWQQHCINHYLEQYSIAVPFIIRSDCHPSDCALLNSIKSSLVVCQSYVQMSFWKDRNIIHKEGFFLVLVYAVHVAKTHPKTTSTSMLNYYLAAILHQPLLRKVLYCSTT